MSIGPGFNARPAGLATWASQDGRTHLVSANTGTHDVAITALAKTPPGCEPPAPPARFLRGDCDGDGVVAGLVTDAVALLNFNFLGGAEPSCLAACDANGDGVVRGQVGDAVYLLNFSFQGGAPLPAPYPDCGAGNDRDAALGCAESRCP